MKTTGTLKNNKPSIPHHTMNPPPPAFRIRYTIKYVIIPFISMEWTKKKNGPLKLKKKHCRSKYIYFKCNKFWGQVSKFHFFLQNWLFGKISLLHWSIQHVTCVKIEKDFITLTVHIYVHISITIILFTCWLLTHSCQSTDNGDRSSQHIYHTVCNA